VNKFDNVLFSAFENLGRLHFCIEDLYFLSTGEYALELAEFSYDIMMASDCIKRMIDKQKLVKELKDGTSPASK